MAKSDLNSIYTLEKKDDEFVLNSEGGLLLTPGGNVVSDKAKKLLQLINEDIAVNAQLDASIFGYYSIYCSYKDYFRNNEIRVSKKKFRQIIECDITLKTVAGRESGDQLNCWESLTDHLDKAGLEHTIYGSIDSFEKIVGHFYKIHRLLSPAQKAAAINSAQMHESIIYGIFLAAGHCSEREYAIAIAAGNCIIPGVFHGVTKSGFNQFVKRTTKEAKILTNFIRYTSS